MHPGRYRLIQYLFLIAFLAIIYKLAVLQIFERDYHQKRVESHKVRSENHMARSEICDRDGKILALDIDKYILEYNPDQELQPKESLKIFDQLAALINLRPELARRIQKNYSSILAYNLRREDKEAIEKLKLPNLHFRKVLTRYYPENSLASHIIGFVDIAGEAKQGVELEYKDYLGRSTNNKIFLSIDSKLQSFIESKLSKRLIETKAQKGTAIVMKVNTGEILAWATKPDYDPNIYQLSPIHNLKNWSLVDVYQPGSVFKVITVASALDSRVIRDDYTYLDKGFIKVQGWKISNHDYVKDKTKPIELDLQGLFQKSSNTFSTHIAKKLGPEKFTNYMKVFGFGTPTQVGLPGESPGIIKNYQNWTESDIASTSIGQGAISVTPIQMITAVNAIANNGKWIKPSILSQDSLKKLNLKQNSFNIIDKQIAKDVQKLLRDSIQGNIQEHNTKAGKIKGLEVAGKTGTSQKLMPNGRYSHQSTIASFIGFFPATAPEYTVLVVIDDPKTDGGWGETVSGPVFNQIASYVKNLNYNH